MKLEGKVAIVTGSSKGIGKGIADEFIKEGAKVVISSRHEDEGLATAKELGMDEGKCIFVKADVSKVEDCKALIQAAIDKWGRLDILMNNAGYHNLKGLEAIDDDGWDMIIHTNLYSMYYMCKYALPYLKETKGNIINMSSMVGKVGQADSCAYSATKGGQIACTKNMAIDLAKYGIRVNAICPGWIATPLVTGQFEEMGDAFKQRIFDLHPVGRIGTPNECGRLAVFLASDEESGFITGVAIEIDGGITLGY